MRDSLARLAALMAFCALSLLSAGAHSADTGLITVASKHSVPETIRRFEDAVRAKGWKFFTEIDHAAAAREVGLELKPRTVIIFGFPKGGTVPSLILGPECGRPSADPNGAGLAPHSGQKIGV